MKNHQHKFYFLIATLLSCSSLYAQYDEYNYGSPSARKFQEGDVKAKFFPIEKFYTTYVAKYSGKDGIGKYADIGIETSLVNVGGNTGNESDEMRSGSFYLVPVTVDLRLPLNVQDDDISTDEKKIRQLKIGLIGMRGSIYSEEKDKDYFFDMKGLSFVLRNHLERIGTYYGGRITEITFNSIIAKDKKIVVELELKIALGLGYVEKVDKNIADKFDKSKIAIGEEVAIDTAGGLTLRIGIAKKLFLELFGDAEVLSIANIQDYSYGPRLIFTITGDGVNAKKRREKEETSVDLVLGQTNRNIFYKNDEGESRQVPIHQVGVGLQVAW